MDSDLPPQPTATSDHANPDLGKTAEELALEREIAELAAQGREEERGAAADRLAALRMARTFGKLWEFSRGLRKVAEASAVCARSFRGVAEAQPLRQPRPWR